MAEGQDDYRAHMETYTSFNKLVTFTLLWIVLILVAMALGLVGHMSILALLLGVGGSVALLVAFAVLGCRRSLPKEIAARVGRFFCHRRRPQPTTSEPAKK